MYFFTIKSHISKSGRHTCVTTSDYNETFVAVDSALYSFGPFILMSIINFTIVFKFVRAKWIQSNSTESTDQALSKSATRGTAMVVTVSVTFLILTTPVGLSNALFHVKRLSYIPLYRAFMNITQYLNHSINGVLYCIVGSKLRRKLINLFDIKRKRRSDTSIQPPTPASPIPMETTPELWDFQWVLHAFGYIYWRWQEFIFYCQLLSMKWSDWKGSYPASS